MSLLYRCALLALAAASLTLQPGVSAPGGGPIALTNGDFEAGGEGVKGWTYWSRTGDGSAMIAPDAHAGKGAARVQYPGEKDWALTSALQHSVKAGQEFTASAWVKGTGRAILQISAYGGGKIVAYDQGQDEVRTGPEWHQLVAVASVPAGVDHVVVRVIGGSKSDLLVDDVTLREGAPARTVKPLVQGFAQTRIREKLDRGMVAMPTAGNRVYIGWRLLDTDPKGTAFNLYRRQGQGAAQRLNPQPLTKTTDFVDEKPPAGPSEYFVRTVIGGNEGAPSETATATPSAEGQAYLSFKLAGDHTFQKAAIADLDGDGRYDFVLKQPDSNVDPYGAPGYWHKSPGTYTIEAYRNDGKLLWTHDMGWAIEQGMWYSPYVVYDLDGDGKAEVALKSGEGDPRDEDGRVKTGPEYLCIVDGMTGKEKARLDWPSREGYPDYNYYCRNQLGVAYLDGKTPALIVERGTYNVIKVIAYEYHDGKLRELWRWNDREERGRYAGQGAHCLRAADVDGDGRDEVILGSAVLDDNGVGLWTTGLGHPDHTNVGDLDPAHPGLEIEYGIEPGHPANCICMVDAKTGTILWGLKEATKHVHSSGLCADLDPAHPGVESYAGERDFTEKRWIFSADGQLLASGKDLGGLAPRAAYWDGDMQRELLARGGRLTDYESGNTHEPRIEGTVHGQADILGDWREEIITTVKGELRIYTTTIPATDRRPCLMQDPIYRLDVAGGSQGYWQIPSLQVLPGTEK